MPQIAGREVGQAVGFHKPFDTAGHGVGVAGLEYPRLAGENEAVRKDGAGVFLFPLDGEGGTPFVHVPSFQADTLPHRMPVVIRRWSRQRKSRGCSPQRGKERFRLILGQRVHLFPGQLGAVNLPGLDALRVVQVFLYSAQACFSQSAATCWAAFSSVTNAFPVACCPNCCPTDFQK